MSEVETFIKHLRELEYVIEEEAPGHPRAWTVLTNMRQLVGPFYTLESGRILQLVSPLLRIAHDVFGPDWKTLAMLCGGQAPTIGRIVHIWSPGQSTPDPAIIEAVYDDASVVYRLRGGGACLSPYGGTKLIQNYWTWPRIVR